MAISTWRLLADGATTAHDKFNDSGARCRKLLSSHPDDAVASIYGELRRLAAFYMRRERSGHTLQPTAL